MILSHEKVIFLPKEKILLLADVHLGKVSHFRKEGIGIPQDTYKQDFRSLNDVIIRFSPKHIVIMGDLFHSTYNREWDDFIEFISVFENLQFTLVKGNHDILQKNRYLATNFKVVEELLLDKMIITHEPLDIVPDEMFNIYGHIHPAVRIRGRSKQSLRLPCFMFYHNRAIMPAFGRFTGLATQKPTVENDIYVISDNSVIHLST
jgi:DNA ligase-associated metallophosphoesterase